MWHSLDEYGKIEIYDVEWSDGTVETNIPVAMLESVREGSHTEAEEHGVQEKDTPVNERNYKGKMMKITKTKLKEIISTIIKEEKTEYQKFFDAALEKFGVDSPADFKDEEKKKEFFDYVDKNYKAENETD